MDIVADFHVHSRFSRACSNKLTLPELDNWGRAKGTDILGTGDFTHPVWFSEIQTQLEPVREGMFRLRPTLQTRSLNVAGDPNVEFMLTAEIATIWSQGGKLRRMHTILVAPSMEAAERLNKRLDAVGKLRSDGRPVLGMASKTLADLAWSIDEDFLVIPAHAWTPWFAVFGSQSGFDSLEECYGELANRIPAIETGFSSNPPMNWRVSALDTIALVSNSDAHSLPNLGREATVFTVQSRNDVTLRSITQMVREGAPAWRQVNKLPENFLKGTYEFLPEEGKYHMDGHRACNVRLQPDQTKNLNGICPSCGRPVTVGVYSRVVDLADRPEGFKPQGAPDFWTIVPLAELVAGAVGVGKGSKKVTKMVEKLWAEFGSELQVLLTAPLEQIAQIGSPELAMLIGELRQNKLTMTPGYDGVYGTLNLPSLTPKQSSLFAV